MSSRSRYCSKPVMSFNRSCPPPLARRRQACRIHPFTRTHLRTRQNCCCSCCSCCYPSPCTHPLYPDATSVSLSIATPHHCPLTCPLAPAAGCCRCCCVLQLRKHALFRPLGSPFPTMCRALARRRQQRRGAHDRHASRVQGRSAHGCKPRTRRQPPRWRHTRARAVQWRGEASA